MSTRWPAAKSELGLEIEWRFAFVPQGTVVPASPGTIVLDVGGSIGPGVIDHHQGTPRRCSASSLLLERPDLVFDHLVGPWLVPSARSAATHGGRTGVRFRIVLHRGPDFDALVSAAIAMRLVEDGEFPWWASAAVEMADRVDQGREGFSRADSGYGLYPRVLMLSYAGASRSADPDRQALFDLARDMGKGEFGDLDEARAWLGLDLIDREFASGGRRRLHGGSERPEPRSKLESWLDERLDRDGKEFGMLLGGLGRPGAALRDLGTVRVPAEEGEDRCVGLRASALVEIRPLACNKLYLRKQGLGTPERPNPTPLTVIRASLEEGGPERPDRRRFIVSVDPEFRVGSDRPTLRGLGAALEELEQRERARLGQAELEERSGTERYPEYPGVKDPWYDGRGHGFTIVDTPKVGTVLGLDQILSVLRQSFWQPSVRDHRFLRCMPGRGMDGEVAIEPAVVAEEPQQLRLGRLLEAVEESRRGGGLFEGFMVVVADVSPFWGERALARFADKVAGRDAERIVSSLGVAHVGRAGVAILSTGPATSGWAEETARRLVPALQRIRELVEVLRETDESLGARGAGARSPVDDRPDRACRGHLRRLAESLAEFHSGRVNSTDPELHSVVRAIEDRLELESRARGVGQLLEHLNDDRERALAAQLNRILLLVGLFGVLQTLSQVTENLGWGAVPNWTFLGLCGLIASLGLLSFSSGFLRWARHGLDRWAFTRGFAEMFLDDVEMDRTRSPSAEATGSAKRRTIV